MLFGVLSHLIIVANKPIFAIIIPPQSNLIPPVDVKFFYDPLKNVLSHSISAMSVS